MSLSSHHFSISSSLATKSTFGSTESKWLATFFFLMPGACFLLDYSELCSRRRLMFELKTKPAPKWFRDGRFEIKRYRGTTLVSRRTIAYRDTQLSRCNVRLGRFSLVSRFPRISVNSSGVIVDSVPMLASTVPSSLKRGGRNRLCLRRYL